MKIAKTFWILGSLLINVVIGIYVYLQSQAPQDKVERYAYLNENWALYGGHWKVELLVMALLTIAACFFAIRTQKISWSIITVGQFILLMTYPFMLGGYHNTPLEIAEMANEMATVVFLFGNILFLGGLFVLYLNDTLLHQWLKVTAYTLSGFMTLVFLISYAGFLSWAQVMVVAPLANVIYLINAYYGTKISMSPTSA
ncbi:MAG: hypothetical protein HRT65_09950 [Flavobacteriaceae bacterium]|nr:hypothetical protein [Flavobacteriaceae bacterium]